MEAATRVHYQARERGLPWAFAIPLLWVALVLPLSAQQPAAQPPASSATLATGTAGPCADPGLEAARRSRALAYLEEVRAPLATPGLSAAVMSKGRLLFSEGLGFADLENKVPATAATVYNVGSVSKAISAVAVMQLVEEGKVHLDDPIQRYVPSFPLKRWPVTLRHLLTHTSGIRHYRSDDFPANPVDNLNCRPYSTLEEAIGIFKDDPLLFRPGTYYAYSSYAVDLLQGVVESASGMGFEDYLRLHVWGPAGMDQTAFDVPERIVPHRARGYIVEDGEVHNHPFENVSYKYAGGGMISTAEDLARLGTALLQGRLLKPETLKLMFEPALDDGIQVVHADRPLEPMRWRQALIWRIRTDEQGRDYVHHCGSVKGFNACLLIWVDEGLVVATADNADSLGLRPGRGLAEIFREACGAAP